MVYRLLQRRAKERRPRRPHLQVFYEWIWNELHEFGVHWGGTCVYFNNVHSASVSFTAYVGSRCRWPMTRAETNALPCLCYVTSGSSAFNQSGLSVQVDTLKWTWNGQNWEFCPQFVAPYTPDLVRLISPSQAWKSGFSAVKMPCPPSMPILLYMAIPIFAALAGTIAKPSRRR